jgi:hypothetical protein
VNIDLLYKLTHGTKGQLASRLVGSRDNEFLRFDSRGHDSERIYRTIPRQLERDFSFDF